MKSPREYQPVWLTQKPNKQLDDWRSHSSIQTLSILLSIPLTRDWHVPVKIRVKKEWTVKQEWEEKNKCCKQGEMFSEAGSLTTHTWSEELAVCLGYKLAKPVMPLKQKNATWRSARTCHIIPLGLIFTRSASSGQILVCNYRLNSCLHAAVCH